MISSHNAVSYYQVSAKMLARQPALVGEINSDVCVVGGGYTGLSAALELRKAGFNVVLLEAEYVGYGASGRNGGQICTGFSASQEKIIKQLGREDAAKCFVLTQEAKKFLVHNIEAHEISCDLRWGYLHVVPKKSQFDGLKEWQAEWADLGYRETEIINKEELSSKLGTDIYHGALRESEAGQLHPLNYCLGLARAALQAGVIIYEGSPVIKLDLETNRVYTAQGSVKAKFVVLAGGAYLGRTVPQLYGRIMPVSSYIIATEPLGETMAASLIRDGEAVADTNFIVDYFRITADCRLLFGGRASYSTLEPANLATYMRPRMIRVFPQLQKVKIDYAWGGCLGITSNRLPDIGRLTPQCYYAHGYSGHGLVLSGFYGKLISEAICGQAGRYDLLARIKHFPFPGGAIRTPLLVAAMLYYRIKDALS